MQGVGPYYISELRTVNPIVGEVGFCRTIWEREEEEEEEEEEDPASNIQSSRLHFNMSTTSLFLPFERRSSHRFDHLYYPEIFS